MEINPLLLTLTEAGKLLGFSRWTVDCLCRKEGLHFIPRGRRGKRIPRSEIDLWIKRKTVHSGEELKRAVDARRRP